MIDDTKIFYINSYHKGIFMILPDNRFYVRVINNNEPDFGKLTASFKPDTGLTLSQIMELYPHLNKSYLNFIQNQHSRLRVIWNCEYEGHKIGELFTDESKYGYPYNLVCHHIGRYRRIGYRAIDDAWKLGIAGLNCQEFITFRKPKKNKLNINYHYMETNKQNEAYIMSVDISDDTSDVCKVIKYIGRPLLECCEPPIDQCQPVKNKDYNPGKDFIEWAEKFWNFEKVMTKGLVPENKNSEACSYEAIRSVFIAKINVLINEK